MQRLLTTMFFVASIFMYFCTVILMFYSGIDGGVLELDVSAGGCIVLGTTFFLIAMYEKYGD